MKRILIIAYMSLRAAIASGQDPESDLKALCRLYAGAGNFSMKVEMTLLFPPAGQAPHPDVYRGWVKKSGGNYMSSLGGKTTLLNARCLVLVMDDRKTILVNDPPAAGSQGDEEKSRLAIIDSLFYTGKQLRYVSAPPDHKKIEIRYAAAENAPYEKMELTYIPGRQLEEIVYYYKDQQRSTGSPSQVHIRYSELKVSAAADFSEKQFIRKSRGSYVPASNYSTYRVIDQRKSPLK